MNIGFLITARLKSSRLPLKILKDLNGKSVVERIIDRAKAIQGITKIVLCTSPNPQDKPLVDIAKRNNIAYSLGDEEDVLQRLYDAATCYNVDYFLGITADNPLFSIHYSNVIVDTIKRQGHDFIKVDGLPLGAATYGMKYEALATVCNIKTVINTEIWGHLINRPELFDVITIKAEGIERSPNLRLTLDYEQDYQVLSHLYTSIPFETTLDLKDAVEYLHHHPEIAKINQQCVQRDLDEKTKKIIDKHYRQHFTEIKKIKERIYRENPR